MKINLKTIIVRDIKSNMIMEKLEKVTEVEKIQKLISKETCYKIYSLLRDPFEISASLFTIEFLEN